MTISKDITRILLVGIGITSLASLIYFAGPLIAIGNFRPFESYDRPRNRHCAACCRRSLVRRL